MKNVNMNVKSITCAKKIAVGILAYLFIIFNSICNSRYLKSITDDSVIFCNEIIRVTDSVSTNVTNSVSTNVTSTVSMNSNNQEVRYNMDCYILHIFLLVAILLFIITISSVKWTVLGHPGPRLN